jgi:hypothetical protein
MAATMWRKRMVTSPSWSQYQCNGSHAAIRTHRWCSRAHGWINGANGQMKGVGGGAKAIVRTDI